MTSLKQFIMQNIRPFNATTNYNQLFQRIFPSILTEKTVPIDVLLPFGFSHPD